MLYIGTLKSKFLFLGSNLLSLLMVAGIEAHSPQLGEDDASPADRRVSLLKSVGSGLIKIGDKMDKVARRLELRQLAFDSEVTKLDGCRE